MKVRDQFDPSRADAFLTPGRRHLAWAILIFGILLLTGGVVLFTLIAGLEQRAVHALARLLLLGWAMIPIVSGYVLLRASRKIASPARGSSIFIVVTVVSALVGLAWAAVTAAVFLNPHVAE